MISVVICSVNPELSSSLIRNIDLTIGVPYEVIVFDNRVSNYSISKVYNQGAVKAKFNCLCFVHEDVAFRTDGWGKFLLNHFKDPGISLIGILGSGIKTKIPSGVFLPNRFFYRVNQIQRRGDNSVEYYYENPLNETCSEVKILDGMFLATTMNYFRRYRFDEVLLTAFHGYDIDFSLGQSELGRVIVVYDILLEHFSTGGNTVSWIDEQLKLTKKWNDKLPIYNSYDKREVSDAERSNAETFFNALIVNKYDRFVQFNYLIKLIAIRPFKFNNIRFIGKFILANIS